MTGHSHSHHDDGRHFHVVHPSRIWFFVNVDGRPHFAAYDGRIPKRSKTAWLCGVLKSAYATLRREPGLYGDKFLKAPFRFFFRGMNSAYFMVWGEREADQWELLYKDSPIEASPDTGYHLTSSFKVTSQFQQFLDNPPDRDLFSIPLGTALSIGVDARGHGLGRDHFIDYVIVVEILEGLSLRAVWWALGLVIVFSILSGVLLGVLNHHLSNAISLASGLSGFFGFVVVVVALLEWISLDDDNRSARVEEGRLEVAITRARFDSIQDFFHSQRFRGVVTVDGP